jgi:hypothetical protein
LRRRSSGGPSRGKNREESRRSGMNRGLRQRRWRWIGGDRPAAVREREVTSSVALFRAAPGATGRGTSEATVAGGRAAAEP